jgi:hypothetical protein
MPKFSIGQKVFNLDGKLAEIADIVDADDYPLYALKYADGKVGAACWEDHELTPAKECPDCSGTGISMLSPVKPNSYFECKTCEGKGYVHDQAPGE